MSDLNRGQPATSRDAKYQAAASWAADVHGSLRASRRVAWIVATTAGIVAALEALALAGLAPLKTVVPYTIEVDRQTGYVQMVKGLKPGPLSETSAVTQSFLVQYVIARETFDAADLRDNYRKVTLWSAGEARNSYENDLRKTNPSSPLNLYSPTTIVSTTIDSVSLLSQTTALVRFETLRRDSGGAITPQGAFVAVMAFRYTGAPMRMEDRFLNPLGFQVISYRRDSNTVSSSSATAFTGPNPAAVTIAPPPVLIAPARTPPPTILDAAPNNTAGPGAPLR